MASKKFENSHSESSERWFSLEGLTDHVAFKFYNFQFAFF